MFFCFIHQDNLLLNQQLAKRLIQKYLLFYQKIPRGILHQNLELMKLMNFFVQNIACGLKY